MPRWEFCKVVVPGSFIEYYDTSGARQVACEPSEECEDGDCSASLIAELGQDGWELVTVLALRGTVAWYFKRPMPILPG